MTDGIDIRHLPYMPLHIERLRKSKSWLRCKRRPELAFYLMNLWMRAWHEVPAGSLDDDDGLLSEIASCEPGIWQEVREQVLWSWGWHDGRWWAPDVAADARDAIERRKKYGRRIDKRMLIRSAAWAEIRFRVFQRDGFTCQYCGAVGVRLECDHVIPWTAGGPTSEQNLKTACVPCNRSKGAKPLREWLQ